MPNLNLRRFSNPDTLSRIKPESLIEWLQPARAYLGGRGVTIPAAANDGPVNLDALAGLFLDPEPDMPAYPKNGECWFLVRHGLPCKREGVMDGVENASIFYRPRKHDVLVYNAAAGEIRPTAAANANARNSARPLASTCSATRISSPAPPNTTWTPSSTTAPAASPVATCRASSLSPSRKSSFSRI